MKHYDSLIDLFRAFPNEAACLNHLRAMRWRKGEFCPHCGHDKIYEFSDKRTFKCAQCRMRFSLKVGTIFEDSKLPLQTWFAAMWLITNHPKGIASTTLAEDLHVTQKTAWFVLHRLRHAARTKSFDKPLDGIVEVDEAFVGGKATNKHGRRSGVKGGAKGKTPVIGAAQRKGGVVMRVVRTGIGGPDAVLFVDAAISPDADMVITDAHRNYALLDRYPEHQTVNHAKGEHRRGIIHTQTIESVWGMLKRQIIGIHHWVSPKHLQNYVNEMAWRMSRRDLTVTDRMNAMFTEVEGRLTYKALIA